MALYVTAKGQWSGSAAQAAADAAAEGSDPKAVQPVDLPFPASKADVLGLLNSLRAAPPAKPAKPEPAPDRLPVDPEAPRWRVFCRGVFVAATRAPSAKEATRLIAAELTARQCG